MTQERGKRKARVTPAQIEARRQKEVLLLSRARVQDGLRASQNQRYRDQLTRALADIEEQLSALESVAS